jgi:hypothetical protein
MEATFDIQAVSEGNLSGENAQRHDQLPYSQGGGADRFDHRSDIVSVIADRAGDSATLSGLQEIAQVEAETCLD